MEFFCNEISNSNSSSGGGGGSSLSPLDARDGGGNTPLHLAAGRGALPAAAALLRHGADPGARNDVGLRPSECAALRSNSGECAEFLWLYETSLGLARQSALAQSRADSAQSESEEVKGLFREVLSTAKRLAKERDEMCRELGRLYEAMLELHNNMTMEIQVLRANKGKGKKEGSSESSEEKEKKEGEEEEGEEDEESSNIAACTTLHQRWQQHQRQWFSSGLIDSEHKLMVAEDGWKRVRQQQQQQQQDPQESYLQRMLRDRVEELRSRPPPPAAAAASTLSSSSSEEGDGESDPEDGFDEDDQEAAAMRRLRRNIAQRKKLATPSPPDKNGGGGGGVEGESIYSSLSNDAYYSKIASPDGSVNLGGAKVRTNFRFSRKKIFFKTLFHSQTLTTGSLTMLSRKSPVAPPSAPLSSSRRRVVRSREELRQKLKEFSLTSESGTASVLEVIEPTSSEEEEFKRSMREMNMTWTTTSAAEPR